MQDIKYFGKEGREVLGEDQSWGKVTWAAGPKYGPFKPRDFCTVVQFIARRDGSRVVLNRPAYHSDFAPVGSHVRACVLLAGNIMEPIDGGRRTRYPFYTQHNSARTPTETTQCGASDPHSYSNSNSDSDSDSDSNHPLTQHRTYHLTITRQVHSNRTRQPRRRRGYQGSRLHRELAVRRGPPSFHP